MTGVMAGAGVPQPSFAQIKWVSVVSLEDSEPLLQLGDRDPGQSSRREGGGRIAATWTQVGGVHGQVQEGSESRYQGANGRLWELGAMRGPSTLDILPCGPQDIF